MSRRLIVCADDFGRDKAINEAVEISHQGGILTCASDGPGSGTTFTVRLPDPEPEGTVAPPTKVIAEPRTRKTAARKAPAVKRPTKPADLPREICPTCFMAVPRSGVCDNCG